MKTKLTAITGMTLISSALFVGPINAETGLEKAVTKSEQTAQQLPVEISAEIHDMFVKLDKNKDGFIEKSEAKGMSTLEKEYSVISKNGKLNEQGFASWHLSKAATGTQQKSN